MYQEFYRLTESPFRLSPDARYFLALGGHRKALAYLRYGLQKREGLIVVTGVPGTGKTTIARLLVAEAARDGVVVSQLNTTRLDADNVIEMVAAAYGLPHDGRSKASLLTQLEAFFLARARAGKHLLLLIDEAQNLPVQSLEELRMLSNFQLGNHALLQIFLLGQQQFRQMLQLPEMEQLRQRVVAACHLEPLNRDETREYIEHRLRLAGWTGDPVFTGDAVDSVFQATRGIPRNINTFCERLLLFGALEGLHALNRASVMSVVRELRQEAAETVGAAPLASELTATQESLTGGIAVEGVNEALAPQPAAAMNPFALDLTLSTALPPSASTRAPSTVAMHAVPGVLNDNQSLMATMTGPSGAMGMSMSTVPADIPLVISSTTGAVPSVNVTAQATETPSPTAPTVNLRATENSTINKVMPGISTVTAKTSSVAANETVTAAATRMPVAPKTTSVGQVQNTPPPAKLSPSETVTRVAPSTPASTAVPPARATPMPPVSAEAPTNNIARSAPQSAAPPRVEPKKPVPPETIAASVPSNEGQGVKVNRTGVQTPVQKSATAESPVPSTTVNPVVPATLAVPAAARKAAPVAPAALATATAGDEEDDIPVLTVENHALAKGVTTRRLDAEATPSPVTPNAKKAPEPVVKTTEKSLPEVKVAPPVVTPPTAKTSVENEKVVAASGSKPKTSADEFEKAAQDGANKPAPSVKTPPRSPVGGNSGNGSGSVGRSGSLAPAASRPAAQTTRLPSPLQRLILVAEQIQANPSPSEALELVASALLEPLPELLQFAFSKEPLNEEWSAVLTNRAPGEVRELARQFIKTVIMAPSSDLYQVLCLTRDATDEQVQNNYRALFKLLQSGPGKEVHPAAAARLNHAYQVLRDPARRLAYEISPNAVTAEAASEPSPLVSTAQEAPTISAVEAVSVPSPQTAAVEPVDAEEVEDEEVAEAHWWLPRPAILIGVGVVIASVFGVVIWQLSQSPAANSTAAADAANSAESSAPRAFSAAVGSVPNSAETKPAATTKETTSLGGGVPAPVTHADLQILVKKLTSTYERGNIDNFVALFDSNVKTNDGTGVAGVRDDYQKLFKDTRRRNMDITNLRWQFSGPTAKGDGDFRVVILSGDGSEHEVKGKLKLQVAKMGEQAYITGMDYKYGPGAQ